MPLAGTSGSDNHDRPGFFSRWWWVIAIFLLLIPAALVVYFVLATPNVETFQYSVR
jgi:hypothetical protein